MDNLPDVAFSVISVLDLPEMSSVSISAWQAQFMQGKGRGRGAPPSATERNLEVTSHRLGHG